CCCRRCCRGCGPCGCCCSGSACGGCRCTSCRRGCCRSGAGGTRRPQSVGQAMPNRLETTGSVPIPDPTTLTTNAVNAAREQIEKLFDVKLNGFRELVD